MESSGQLPVVSGQTWCGLGISSDCNNQVGGGREKKLDPGPAFLLTDGRAGWSDEFQEKNQHVIRRGDGGRVAGRRLQGYCIRDEYSSDSKGRVHAGRVSAVFCGVGRKGIEAEGERGVSGALRVVLLERCSQLVFPQ